MSRIYEAIQRADHDRAAVTGSGARHVIEPVVAPYAVELPEVKVDLDLSSITHHPWKPSDVSLPTLARRGATVEQFRSLRSRIDQLRFEAPLKTILVSSGMPAEGKTFVAANLALSMARNNGSNILLIDGDLRRGTLHTLLGAPNCPGLSEYLGGAAEFTSIMQRSLVPEKAAGDAGGAIANITFIAAGLSGDNSSEMVASNRLENLISTLSPHFDWIVIDSPPVLAVTDAIELARTADGVLLVARAANTPFDVAHRTQTAFSNSRILGFVLNSVRQAPRNHSYSNYYGGEE
jgi:protein-tyrosine kinase